MSAPLHMRMLWLMTDQVVTCTAGGSSCLLFHALLCGVQGEGQLLAVSGGVPWHDWVA